MRLINQQLSVFLFILFIFSEIATAQDKLELPTTWQLLLDDNEAFATLKSKMNTPLRVDIGRPLPQRHRSDKPQIVWYGTDLFIPESWEKPATEAGGVVISLGHVVQADELWVNGVRVGKTGTMPPNISGLANSPRVYVVPAAHVRWGLDNRLAVRVGMPANGGGMVAGPYEVRLATDADFIQLSWDIDAASGNDMANLAHDDTLSLSVQVLSQARQLKGRQEVTLRNLSLGTETSQQSNITVPTEEPLAQQMRFMLDTTGIYRLVYDVSDKKGSWQYTDSITLATRLKDIAIGASESSQVASNYWRGQLHRLEGEVQQLVREDTLQASMLAKSYEVALNLGELSLKGWLSVPLDSGSFLARVVFAGWGESAQPISGGGNQVVLSVALQHALYGHKPGSKAFTEWAEVNVNIEMSYLESALAAKWLSAHPAVETIVTEGVGLGGSFALAAAGLGGRYAKGAIAIDPWMCKLPVGQEAYDWVQLADLLAKSELALAIPYRSGTWDAEAQYLAAAEIVDRQPHTRILSYSQEASQAMLPLSLQAQIRTVIQKMGGITRR